MSRLAELPVDVLKIDRSFVAKLDSDPRSGRKLVGTVIGLAHAFGMKAVAEGVETESQRAQLWQMKCDEAQGYLFSRPLTTADLLAVHLATVAAVTDAPQFATVITRDERVRSNALAAGYVVE